MPLTLLEGLGLGTFFHMGPRRHGSEMPHEAVACVSGDGGGLGNCTQRWEHLGNGDYISLAY